MTEPSPSPAPPNLLIVDDTPANLHLLTDMLVERGYRVRPVTNGRAALQAARIEPPDLILLDICMPELSGFEVCERLKADTALNRIPVIFLSALNEPLDKVKAFGTGGVDYITKPFQCEEVEARVRTHLGLRRLQAQLEDQNRRLQESYEQLRALEAQRDNLTHMIVHDMRSPLTVILAALDMIKPTLTGPDKNDDLIEMARHSARGLTDMATQMLDVSRLEAGQMPLSKAECDVAKLARDAIEPLRLQAGDRRLQVVAAEPILVTCDADVIRRVIGNLATNALKFTPNGGAVSVVLTRAGAGVRVAVSDTGRGIAPEDRSRLFKKFGQLAGEARKMGVGLGLAFCKLAVEAHGGTVGVDSEVDKGSTFWFVLP